MNTDISTRYTSDDIGKLEYKKRESMMFNVDVMDNEGHILSTSLIKGFSKARNYGIGLLKNDKDAEHFVRVCCYKHPELVDFVTHHRIRKFKGRIMEVKKK